MIVSTENGKDVNYSSFLLTNTLSKEEKSDKYNLPIGFRNSKNAIESFGVANKNENEDEDDKSTDPNALISTRHKNDVSDNPIYDGKVSFMINSFDSLVAAIGVSGNRLTKDQLIAYLQKLASESADSNLKEISFLKNLVAKFETLSNGNNYISSFYGVNEAQDYSTITKEQVTSPIDIRI